MVKHVSIQNFKSIKSLEFEARRVNVFIGEPNTGKSNILEGLGIFCLPIAQLGELIRHNSLDNLFYDNEVGQPIQIVAENFKVEIRIDPHYDFTIKFDNATQPYKFPRNGEQTKGSYFDSPFRFYKFSTSESFNSELLTFLSVPSGKNLPIIIKTNKKVRQLASDVFREKGYRLGIRMEAGELEMVKDVDNELFHYPYRSVSDTLQRIIFYLAAIETNKDSILLLEEPEANTSPPYTKELAKNIAIDESNQYFIVTHSPYLLDTLIQKTPSEELNVFNTYMEDYQTKLYRLSNEELSEVWDYEESAFFNLDRYLPDGKIHR